MIKLSEIWPLIFIKERKFNWKEILQNHFSKPDDLWNYNYYLWINDPQKYIKSSYILINCSNKISINQKSEIISKDHCNSNEWFRTIRDQNVFVLSCVINFDSVKVKAIGRLVIFHDNCGRLHFLHLFTYITSIILITANCESI